MPENDLPLAAALGRIPSGVFVLTACKDGRATGMLASWVQQCAFEPPHVSVVVKQGRPMNGWLAAGAPFVLNIVAEGQKELLAHFGKGFALDEPAFVGLELEESPSGQPILKKALGFLECATAARVSVGDHDVVLALVTAGAMHRDAQPMVHIRKSGMRY
jgi:flavin reductase (DIM6/NTAB) family NADH-FMN oxidoreductase RutF